MDRLKLLDASLRAFDTRLPDVIPSLCLATRYRSSSCRSCLDVCPAEALVTSPWLELDADTCRSCGACAAVCRTGALDYDFRSSALRTEYEARTTTDSHAAALACLHVDPAEVEGETCVVPCLGGLSAADLIAAAALGVEQIHLVSGDCRECPDATAETALDLAVSVAGETMTALNQPLVIERTRLRGHEPGAAATSPTVSRRGLLRYVVRGLERAVAERGRAARSGALDQCAAQARRASGCASATCPRSGGAPVAPLRLCRETASLPPAGQCGHDVRV